MHQITIPNQLKILEDFYSLEKSLLEIIENNSAVFFCGENSFDLLGNDLIKALSKSNHINFRIIDTNKIDKNNLENINEQWVVGLGGGKVLDYAKLIAAKNNKPFISVPTLISHDGICSPVSVINGESLGAIMPSALLVPLFLIMDSPIKYIHAGIGDLIANLSAIEDWKLANKFNQEEINDFAVMLSKNAADNVLYFLASEIKKSDFNYERLLKSKKFLIMLIESIALSGIAMSISGNSRPCSGAEHMISHAIDAIHGPGTKALHGIQVLVATMFLEKYREQKISFNDFCVEKILEKIKMPTSFAEINISEQELELILDLAPKTRQNRFTLLNNILIK